MLLQRIELLLKFFIYLCFYRRDSKEKIDIKIKYIYETDTKWTMEFNGQANATDNPYDVCIYFYL